MFHSAKWMPDRHRPGAAAWARHLCGKGLARVSCGTRVPPASGPPGAVHPPAGPSSAPRDGAVAGARSREAAGGPGEAQAGRTHRNPRFRLPWASRQAAAMHASCFVQAPPRTTRCLVMVS